MHVAGKVSRGKIRGFHGFVPACENFNLRNYRYVIFNKN